MRKIVFILALILTICCQGCKKQKPPAKKSDKNITSFVFKTADNPGILSSDIYGTIDGDSIKLRLLEGTDLTALKSSVVHTGIMISPNSLAIQNFSNPVKYTVTAEDGSVKVYVVSARFMSSTKAITSFALKSADNSALTADINGHINGDTISLIFPPGISIKSLVPTVIHTGKSLVPGDKMAQDFTEPLHYTVTAEDGSVKTYVVVGGANVDLFVGCNDGYLYAINAITGSLKWKYATGKPIISSPTVHEGIVYVGSADGYLYAIEASSGTLKWKFTEWYQPITTAPLVYNDKIYFTTYADALSVGGAGALYALDLATGILKWKYTVSYGTGPAAYNGIVYTGSFGYGIFAVDANTGQLKWRYNSGITKSNPAIVNGVLYAGGESSQMFALDALTGVEKWKSGNLGGSSNPTVDNNIVYDAVGAGLMARDASTGAEKWSMLSNGIRSTHECGYFSSLVYDRGTVYAGNDDSYFYAVDAATGTVKWTYGDAIRCYVKTAPHPTAANGIVYVGGYENYLHAFDGETGRLIWRFPTTSPIVSGPVVIDSKNNSHHAGVSGGQN